MEEERKFAKYIGTKYFSNKKYSIRVALYDHGMARVSMVYKRSQKFVWDCRRSSTGKDMLFFDECKKESVWDYDDCFNFLRKSKVAQRWFRKTLRPCIEPFILPCDRVDSQLADEYDNESRGTWRGDIEEIDSRLFGREDIFADERVFNFDIIFWNDEDDLENIDWVAPAHIPKRYASPPPLYVHCDLERLKEISQMVVPDVYNRLVDKYGADKIEKISFRILLGRENKDNLKKHVRVAMGRYDFGLPSVANFWEIPRDFEEEVERMMFE